MFPGSPFLEIVEVSLDWGFFFPPRLQYQVLLMLPVFVAGWWSFWPETSFGFLGSVEKVRL